MTTERRPADKQAVGQHKTWHDTWQQFERNIFNNQQRKVFDGLQGKKAFDTLPSDAHFVEYDGSGYIGHLPAGQLGAEAQIDILVVSKEILIK